MKRSNLGKANAICAQIENYKDLLKALENKSTKKLKIVVESDYGSSKVLYTSKDLNCDETEFETLRKHLIGYFNFMLVVKEQEYNVLDKM